MDVPQPIPIELAAEAVPSETAELRIEIPIVIPSTERCEPAEGSEIVVCAADPEAYRLRPLPEDASPEPERPQLQLGEGATAEAGLEDANVGGTPSNRAMVTVKIDF